MATTNQQMDELMSPDDMMMPQEDVTKERAVKAAKDVLTFGAESTPVRIGLGTVLPTGPSVIRLRGDRTLGDLRQVDAVASGASLTQSQRRAAA